MAHLTLSGVSDDGKRLLLTSTAGVEFTLDIDPRLRAALLGDNARLGQLEIQMDSALRPRDIQARIRAGETPEAVAQAAQTPIERIMAFAAPVLAERQHVADRAQRSSVRRKTGDTSSTGGARTLGDAVTGHLRSLNIDPSSVEWDAWRREDGRWTVTGTYSATKRTGSAHFTFDMPGNYVTVDNDDARWLLGELTAEATVTPGPSPSSVSDDDLSQARQRRLSAVPEEELPLGDDAIELVADPAPTGPIATPYPNADEDPAPEPQLEPEPSAAPAVAQHEGEEPEGEEPEAEQHDDHQPARRPVKKSRGRASVPSWDEIMFGGGKQE